MKYSELAGRSTTALTNHITTAATDGFTAVDRPLKEVLKRGLYPKLTLRV